MAAAGAIPRDPIKESISLELDMINILYVSSFGSHSACASLTRVHSIRLVQILAMNKKSNK